MSSGVESSASASVIFKRSDLALPARALRRSILQLRTSVRACRLSLAKRALLNDHRAGWINHLASNIAGGAADRRTACFAGSLPLIQRCFCYSGVVLFLFQLSQAVEQVRLVPA